MKRIVLDTKDLEQLTCLGDALDAHGNKYYKFEYGKKRITFITYDQGFVRAVEIDCVEYVQLDVRRGIIASIRHYVCKVIRCKRPKRPRIISKKILASSVFIRKGAYIRADLPLRATQLI